MIRPCSCGGEGQLEYYDPVKRPAEHFVRCRACLYIGPVAATERDAIERWNQISPIEGASSNSTNERSLQ